MKRKGLGEQMSWWQKSYKDQEEKEIWELPIVIKKKKKTDKYIKKKWCFYGCLMIVQSIVNLTRINQKADPGKQVNEEASR